MASSQYLQTLITIKTTMRLLLSTLTVTLLTFFSVKGQDDLILTEIMYNSPWEDLEFLEFYNNTSEEIDLAGYAVVDGVDYNFPDRALPAGAFFVITNDSVGFDRAYGSADVAYEWDSGSLRNSGESVQVINAQLDTIISLEYDDISPWPHLADGLGPSINLCDPAGDPNDPNNWQTNYSSTLIDLTQGGDIFADPHEWDPCVSDFEFWLQAPARNIELEDNVILEIPIYYENTEDEGIQVVATPNNSTTALIDVDFRILNDTLDFGPGQVAPEFIVIELIDDDLPEDREFISFNLFMDGVIVVNTPLVIVNILDDDSPLSRGVEIRGVIETADLKVVELFAKPNLELITLINYGLGSANNGGGTDSIELIIRHLLPEDGTCFYITNDTVLIKEFLGPIDNDLIYLTDDLDFNGNDAIELFERGQVIDVFGRIDEDGEGTAWEYTDSWAKKLSPGNRTSFEENNWNYGGVAVLDDIEINDDAANPYPLDCLATRTESPNQLDVEIYPNPTSGLIHLRSSKEMIDIKVFSPIGAALESKMVKGNHHSLDLSAEGTGVYLIQITDAHQLSSFFTVIKF